MNINHLHSICLFKGVCDHKEGDVCTTAFNCDHRIREVRPQYLAHVIYRLDDLHNRLDKIEDRLDRLEQPKED